MEKLSFLVPVYNSSATIAAVVEEIRKAVLTLEKPYAYEIILIDDGSRDGVFEICRSLAAQDPSVRPYRLSRNFGQANALMAGINQMDGDYLICLDDDLQTPPSEFPRLFSTLIQGGYDIVYGYYKKKMHSAFRNMGTKANALMQKMVLNTDDSIHTSSYFVARRFAVDIVRQYDKPFPYLPGLFLQVTGNVTCVPIRHKARAEGRSGYNITKLLSLWLNGFTNFSIKPLRIASFLGIGIACCSFVFILVIFIQKLMNIDIQPGWTSTIILILFIGGIQLFSIGMLGEYVGRIYLSVNKTPQYVIRHRPASAEALHVDASERQGEGKVS